jgi:hypothetical protein
MGEYLKAETNSLFQMKSHKAGYLTLLKKVVLPKRNKVG